MLIHISSVLWCGGVSLCRMNGVEVEQHYETKCLPLPRQQTVMLHWLILYIGDRVTRVCIFSFLGTHTSTSKTICNAPVKWLFLGNNTGVWFFRIRGRLLFNILHLLSGKGYNLAYPTVVEAHLLKVPLFTNTWLCENTAVYKCIGAGRVIHSRLALLSMFWEENWVGLQLGGDTDIQTPMSTGK